VGIKVVNVGELLLAQMTHISALAQVHLLAMTGHLVGIATLQTAERTLEHPPLAHVDIADVLLQREVLVVGLLAVLALESPLLFVRRLAMALQLGILGECLAAHLANVLLFKMTPLVVHAQVLFGGEVQGAQFADVGTDAHVAPRMSGQVFAVAIRLRAVDAGIAIGPRDQMCLLVLGQVCCIGGKV